MRRHGARCSSTTRDVCGRLLGDGGGRDFLLPLIPAVGVPAFDGGVSSGGRRAYDNELPVYI